MRIVTPVITAAIIAAEQKYIRSRHDHRAAAVAAVHIAHTPGQDRQQDDSDANSNPADMLVRQINIHAR